MNRVRIITLGCKVNQYESAAFHTACKKAGLKVVTGQTEAELVIINSCAVTAKAGAQSRQAIRHALRRDPHARILITGCYAEIAAAELAAMPELTGRQYCLVGNSEKDKLVPLALQPELPPLALGSIATATTICHLPVQRFGDRTRAYLRIQDGCENFCTYCIVPTTRGKSRSLPWPAVLSQAEIFAEENYHEVVLTGIHIGNYGHDLDEGLDITALLRRLTLATPALRYRLSSIEPTEISPALITLIGDRPNLLPHLHIPLQSGDDTILGWMGRRYTRAEFAETIALCRRELPFAAIGIDVLTGFPGETEAMAQNTYDLLDKLDFTYLHVFPYSARPGTIAATLPNPVPGPIKEQRVAALRQLSADKQQAFIARQIGTVRPVLVEGHRDGNGLWRGFTDNYIAVLLPGPNTLINHLVSVRLLRSDGNEVYGEIVKHED